MADPSPLSSRLRRCDSVETEARPLPPLNRNGSCDLHTGDVEVGFHVGVLLFPEFEMLDVFGPMQMLRNLSNVSLGQLTKITTIGYDPAGAPGIARPLIRASHGPGVLADCTIDTCPKLHLLVVPGGLGIRSLVHEDKLLTWIASKVRETQLVMSICTGAVLLALAGSLDHKHATSNKKALSWVKQVTSVHPVQWADEARWVEHGKFITSSGVAAGIDAALRLIAVLHGDEVCAKVAELSGYDTNLNSDDDPFHSGKVVESSGKLAAAGMVEADARAETLRKVQQHNDTELRTAILNQQAIKKGMVHSRGGQRDSSFRVQRLHASLSVGTLDDLATLVVEKGGSGRQLEKSVSASSCADDSDAICTLESDCNLGGPITNPGKVPPAANVWGERLQKSLPPSLRSIEITSHVDYSRAREGLPSMRTKLATSNNNFGSAASPWAHLGDVPPPTPELARAAARQPADELLRDDASRQGTSGQIMDILEDMFLNRGAHEETGSDSYDHTSERLLLEKVTAAVDAGEPLMLTMAAFPFKGCNPDKTLGALPDLAEEVALQNIAHGLDAIQEIYPHGARMIIISDGIIWNDLFDVPEARVIEYVFHLQLMARQFNRHIEVSSLYDFFVANDADDGVWDDDRVREHIFEAHMPSAWDICESVQSIQVQSYMRLVLEDMDSSTFADDAARFDAARHIAVQMLCREEALRRFLDSNLRFQHSIRFAASPRYGAMGRDMFTIRFTGAQQAEAHAGNSNLVGLNPLPWQTVAVHVNHENETRVTTQKDLPRAATSLDSLQTRRMSKTMPSIEGIAEHVFFIEHKYVSEKYFACPYEKNGVVQGYQMPVVAFRHMFGGIDFGAAREFGLPAEKSRGTRASSARKLLSGGESGSRAEDAPVPLRSVKSVHYMISADNLQKAPVANDEQLPETTACLPRVDPTLPSQSQSVQQGKHPGCCILS